MAFYWSIQPIFLYITIYQLTYWCQSFKLHYIGAKIFAIIISPLVCFLQEVWHLMKYLSHLLVLKLLPKHKFDLLLFSILMHTSLFYILKGIYGIYGSNCPLIGGEHFFAFSKGIMVFTENLTHLYWCWNFHHRTYLCYPCSVYNHAHVIATHVWILQKNNIYWRH